MPTGPSVSNSKYTCEEYRLEMMLLGLEKQLADPGISCEHKRILQEEVKQLRGRLGMD